MLMPIAVHEFESALRKSLGFFLYSGTSAADPSATVAALHYGHSKAPKRTLCALRHRSPFSGSGVALRVAAAENANTKGIARMKVLIAHSVVAPH